MTATLSREEMERAIREGGSVLFQGRLITRAQDLPAEAVLAQGDAAREAAVREALDAQIAALTAQRAQLDRATSDAPAPSASTPPPATAASDAPAPSASTPPPSKPAKER